MSRTFDKIILGIDPGTLVMGYGVIGIRGVNIEVLELGVYRIPSGDDHTLRLKKIFESVLSLIEKHFPDELAIEAPFFGKNVQSMLKLGRAQGVAMAAGLVREVPISEYSPKRIKQSVTGNGNASKQQVAAMLARMFPGKTDSDRLDATDALAAAVCHHIETRGQKMSRTAIAAAKKDIKKPSGSKKNRKAGKKDGGGWSSYLAKNQDRIHTN